MFGLEVTPRPCFPIYTAGEEGAYFGGEVLEDGGAVNRRRCADAAVTGRTSLQVSVDTTHRELSGNRISALN